MKYMLLIHQGTTPTPPSPEAWDDAVRGRAEGGLRRLQGDQRDARRHAPACSCSRPRRRRPCACRTARRSTTDGPFVEIKEAIGGYLLFEADDLDAAIELAARIPAARIGGAIEVRPIVEW